METLVRAFVHVVHDVHERAPKNYAGQIPTKDLPMRGVVYVFCCGISQRRVTVIEAVLARTLGLRMRRRPAGSCPCQGEGWDGVGRGKMQRYIWHAPILSFPRSREGRKKIANVTITFCESPVRADLVWIDNAWSFT